METPSSELSVRDLVDRAGTSVGAFYARFDDRDAALAWASAAFWERSRELWSDYLARGRWTGLSAATTLTRVVRTSTRVMLFDADRLKAFVRLSVAMADRGLLRAIAEHDRFVASAVADLILEREGEIRHPDPRAAAREGFLRLLAAARSHVVHGRGDRGSPAAEERDLVLCLVQMYGRYLDVHPVPGSYREVLALSVSPPRPRGGPRRPRPRRDPRSPGGD
jgi:AcrR family transcriptional regulator